MMLNYASNIEISIKTYSQFGKPTRSGSIILITHNCKRFQRLQLRFIQKLHKESNEKEELKAELN